jgi:tripartite-type tricarboxylate transporter receptor subunit TctC
MMRRRPLLWSALASAAAAPAAAQDGFPDRPLRLVIPFPPAGGTDAFARRIGTRLAQELGQPVVADNRTGGSGAVGMGDVLRARADGYTLAFGGASTHALYPLVVAKPLYDPLVDFTPVGLVGGNTVCVVARADVAMDLPALAAKARAQPGQLRFANPGTGTYVHMVGEYLAYRARLDWLAVPYRGNGQAMIDMLAGQVDAGTDTVITSLPHHREGTVRIIAVTSAERSPLLPDVPTVAEALDLPGFDAVLWSLLAVRAGTPPELVQRLHDATLRVLADPAFRAELRQGGIEASPPLSPAAVRDFIRAETEKWRPIVAATGVRLD